MCRHINQLSSHTLYFFLSFVLIFPSAEFHPPQPVAQQVFPEGSSQEGRARQGRLLADRPRARRRARERCLQEEEMQLVPRAAHQDQDRTAE